MFVRSVTPRASLALMLSAVTVAALSGTALTGFSGVGPFFSRAQAQPEAGTPETLGRRNLRTTLGLLAPLGRLDPAVVRAFEEKAGVNVRVRNMGTDFDRAHMPGTSWWPMSNALPNFILPSSLGRCLLHPLKRLPPHPPRAPAPTLPARPFSLPSWLIRLALRG